MHLWQMASNYWRTLKSDVGAFFDRVVEIDATEIEGSPLTMDLSANRRPVFRTGSDLGTFRHDNALVIKIDVEDFDPLQADLEYSIQSGSLPPGVSIDIKSGELYGQLARQSAVEKTYNFTIRANRVISTDMNVFTDQFWLISGSCLTPAHSSLFMNRIASTQLPDRSPDRSLTTLRGTD